jgi:hypothetical protein
MRRTPFLFAIFGFLLASQTIYAGEREDALAILEPAIKAHGGADDLTRAQNHTRTARGNMVLVGKDAPFTEEITLALPDRFRHSLEIGPMKTRIVVVVDRTKGWQLTGGMAQDLDRIRLEELLDEMYIFWLTTLVPLKQDRFQLAPLPEIKVNGNAAVGIKVSSRGRGDIKMYFDKGTNLLVKLERRARDQGVYANKEYFYSEHKFTDGVKWPTKIVETINGNRSVEISAATNRVLRSVEDATFGKP